MGNGKSTDERLAELEQTVAYLSRLVLKAREYAKKDPEVALGQARKSAEAICYRLFQDEIGDPGKIKLEDLMTKLQARQVIPPHVVIPLRTIQMYGNYGSHAQVRHVEVSVEWVAPCLSALAEVTQWYFTDYLGIDLPTELKRHEDHFRSVPRHGGRDTEPRVESTANPTSSGYPEGPISALSNHYPFAGEGRGEVGEGEPWTQGPAAGPTVTDPTPEPDPVARPASAAVMAEGPSSGAIGGGTRPDLDQTPVPAGSSEDTPPPRSWPAITTPLRLVALAGLLLLLVLGGIYLEQEVRNDTKRRQDQATAEAARQVEAQAEQRQLALAAEAARAREKARDAEAARQADLADYAAAERIGTADAYRAYLANCAPKGCAKRAEAEAQAEKLALAAETARAREKARDAEAARQADLADYAMAERIGTADAYRAYLANCASKGCAKRAEAQAKLDRLAVKLPDMIRIAVGSFTMGSPEKEPGRSDDEGPQHQVQVVAFELGKTEVTRSQFRYFVEATGYRTDAERNAGGVEGCWMWVHGEASGSYHVGKNWGNPGMQQGDNDPVVCVSWNDAQAYIEWLNGQIGTGYRLPTEAEWEYAARAGTNTPGRSHHEILIFGRYHGHLLVFDSGASKSSFVR